MTESSQLVLFAVLLDWNPSDEGEGNYAAHVWATDPKSAILAVATEMADLPETGLDDSPSERDEFIRVIAAGAGEYAVHPVAGRILAEMHILLSGPEGKLSTQAEIDFAGISNLLEAYLPKTTA